MCRVLIVAPSLDLEKNVSGVSAVANFIIANNKECEYVHFQQGKSDGESGTFNRLLRLSRNYRAWEKVVNGNETLKLRYGAELLRYADATIRCRYEKEKSVIGYRLSDSVKVNGYRLKVKENHTSDISHQTSENTQLSTFNFQLSTWDLIHYNFPLDAFSIVRDYFFMRLAHKRGLPMVIHVHGGLYLFKEQMPFFIKGILKEVFSWENPFIVLSEREKTQIQRLYKTKNVWVLPNCVEVREGIAELDGNGNVNPNLNEDKNKNEKDETLRYETWHSHYETERSSYEDKTAKLYKNKDKKDGNVNGNGTAKLYDNVNVNLNLNEKVDVHVDVDVENGLHFLYLGRIEPNKGMDYLLEAMKVLKEEGRAFTLHFAGIEQGKNGYIEKFQSLLGEQFVYEGIVSGVKKTDLFKRCQIFVLPSLYEGLPMSLLETMAYGLVPVVTNVGSISEYVKDGENGLLIDTRDSVSIVKALKCLITDRELMMKMSTAAYQTIVNRLNPKEYIEKLNQIYAEII